MNGDGLLTQRYSLCVGEVETTLFHSRNILFLQYFIRSAPQLTRARERYTFILYFFTYSSFANVLGCSTLSLKSNLPKVGLGVDRIV